MRKLFIFLTAMAFVAFWTGLTIAGDYHMGTGLLCSDCHTMHSSQQHDYSGGGSAQTWTPVANLLKASDTNTLCLTCHDGQTSAPDVVAASSNVPVYVRSAGALNNTTGTTPYETWKGHTLGVTATAPGSNPTWSTTGFDCAGCHDPHGTANYRNLLPNPGNAVNLTVTYNVGAVDYTKDITEASATLGSTNFPTHYGIANILYNRNSSNSNGSAYGAWCGGCHGNFHSDYSTAGITQYRHPTMAKTLDLTYFNTHTNKVPIMKDAATGIPGCMSCHKAHGNQNAFGLIYMTASGTVTEQGVDTGVYRDLCIQCHNK